MNEYRANMFKQMIVTAQSPPVIARSIAHRFGIPWHRVAELAYYVSITNVVDILSPEDRAAAEADWLTATDCFRRCGSPIEELFLAHCVEQGRFVWRNQNSIDAQLVGVWDDIVLFSLFQQVTEGNYRIDFAITSPNGPRVAIELDGHEWHERTKDQAERDKSRDRRLQEIGWKVLRFTGSEIWRDPVMRVREALRIAGAL